MWKVIAFAMIAIAIRDVCSLSSWCNRRAVASNPVREVSAASARRIWAACRTPCSRIVRPSATKRSESETSSIARARSSIPPRSQLRRATVPTGRHRQKHTPFDSSGLHYDLKLIGLPGVPGPKRNRDNLLDLEPELLGDPPQPRSGVLFDRGSWRELRLDDDGWCTAEAHDNIGSQRSMAEDIGLFRGHTPSRVPTVQSTRQGAFTNGSVCRAICSHAGASSGGTSQSKASGGFAARLASATG